MVGPPFSDERKVRLKREGGGNDCLFNCEWPSLCQASSLHSEPGWVPKEYLWTLKRPLGNNSNKGQQMKFKMSQQKKKLIWDCSRQSNSSAHITQGPRGRYSLVLATTLVPFLLGPADWTTRGP